MFDFGLRLRELRESHKLTQEQLGRKVGRSKPVISSYENNIKFPPSEILVQFAVIFNVSLDYLVGIDKTEMISVSGLSESQKELIYTIVFELKDTQLRSNGLSERQQSILNGLMKEFAKR